MPEESFLLVSLEEDKAKKLAQVLSNDTARKILEYLSKKELATETEISKKLDIALSTVHYNLGHLVKSGLIQNDYFTYSKKGKKIVHYSLSNKYVIIAPKKTDSLVKKLREFLPVLFVVGAISLAIQFWDKISTGPIQTLKIQEEEFLAASADMVMRVPPPQVVNNQEIAMWFLFGSVFALLIYFLWAEVLLKKFKKKQ